MRQAIVPLESQGFREDEGLSNVRESYRIVRIIKRVQKRDDVTMRHGAAGRRSRNRGHGGGGGNNNNNNRRGNQNRMQVFDSNGPDVRIRGTAHQICEKYLTLAKDASSMGERVLYESYMQHAEHYQRIINEWGEPAHESERRFQEQDQPVGVSSRAGDAVAGGGADDLALPASILGKSREAGAETRAASELESV